MKIRKFLGVALALMLASSAALATPNLVINGSFEDGAYGWDLQMGLVSGIWAHNSDHGVLTGCVGHGCVATLGWGAWVGQTVETVAGSAYDLSFWVGENTGPNSELSVFWDGVQVADILNPANNTIGRGGMIQYSFTGLLATSSATAFEVHGRQDPGAIAFDDFSVNEVQAAVPEPASIAMLLTGLGLLGSVSRRKRPSKM